MKKIILLLIVLAFGLNLSAALERYSDRVSNINASNQESEVYDDKYYDMLTPGWENLFSNYKVSNKVTIGFKPNQFPVETGGISVSLEIIVWTYNGLSGFTEQPAITQTLQLDFSDNALSKMIDVSSFTFENAHRIKARILNIQNTAGVNFRPNIYLETAIEVERYYVMSNYQISGAYGASFSGANNEFITFFWPHHPGAEEYELEWSFLNNHDFNINTQAHTVVNPNQIKYDFYENATRVKITDNHYEIPAVFNRGHVVFRIRPIGRQGINFEHRLEGDWNNPESGIIEVINSLNLIAIAEDYQLGKNWANEISYTEDGKRFEQLVYFDGLGRSRQSITRNTTNDQVIIQNAYYDFAGRMAMSDLPVPENSTRLHFRNNFNKLVVNGTEIEVDPDEVVSYGTNCHTIFTPFTTARGSGEYYSASNDDQEGSNAYIPNADGYTYSKDTYYGDIYSRTKEQGSPGIEFQVGEHNLTYHYSNPSQEELTKLFGSEAGYKNQYIKTTDEDHNGQDYIKYYDADGNLIASGLSGGSPLSLVSLENNQGYSDQTTVVYDGAQPFEDTDPAAEISTISHSFHVGEDGLDLTIEHTFDPEELDQMECFPGNCFDCVYDLEIKLTWSYCGEEGIAYSHSQQINGEDLDNVCNGSYNGTATTLDLHAGDYVLTKTLKVNTETASDYFCDFYKESGCIEDYSSIFNALYVNTDLGCNDGEILPLPKFFGCDGYRAAMAAQMAVNGQYGATDPQDEHWLLSVYNTQNNELPNPNASWRSPDGPYINPDGSEARIYLELIGNVYSPPPLTGATIHYDDDLPYIYPQDLANLSDFITAARFSWGDALVIYHPEYCYLQYCERTSEFEVYKQLLLGTETFDEACVLGMFNPLATQTDDGTFQSIPYTDSDIFNNCNDNVDNTYDEYFISGHYGNIRDWIIESYGDCMDVFTYEDGDKMKNYFLLPDGINYLSIWQYAVWQGTDCKLETSYSSILQCIQTTTIGTCEKEAIWKIFRGEYLKSRQEAFYFAQTLFLTFPNMPGGGGACRGLNFCIGEENFIKFPEVGCFDPYTFPTSNGGVPNPIESFGPCADAELYADLIPIFHNGLFEDPLLGDEPVILEEQITAICQLNCEAQAQLWLNNLVNCQIPDNVLQEVRTHLVNVCLGGCDAANIGGSTTLKTPGSYTYNSFEEVIAAYANSAVYGTYFCSEYLISEPRPYGQNGLKTTGFMLDDCGCDIILNANDQLVNNPPPGVTTLAQLLSVVYGIDHENAESLLCLCNNAKGPDNIWDQAEKDQLLQVAIQVPQALSCTQNPCKTCNEIQVAFGNFQTAFPGINTTTINYYTLLENFININLDLNFDSDQYENFLENCDPLNTGLQDCSLNQLSFVFMDMLDVLVRKGQLLNEQPAAVNLTQENIVYTNSGIDELINGNYYWSCGNNCNPSDNLTLNFSDNTSSAQKSITLTLPPGADFTFEDIIGITGIEAVGSCPNENEFALTVEVASCDFVPIRGSFPGLVSKIIYGKTDDLELISCFCATNDDLVLCSSNLSDFVPNTCYKMYLEQVVSDSRAIYETELYEQWLAFLEEYTENCASALATEKIIKKIPANDYQFTLFYYDLNDNLIRTVAPKGVADDYDNTNAYQSMQDELLDLPGHEYNTTYEYNSYNQLTKTTNPDQEGVTRFWYDRYGRLVASQNPDQNAKNKFTYTLFDEFDRPCEVGQGILTGGISQVLLMADDKGESFKQWIYENNRFEVTVTTYDKKLSNLIPPKFLNGSQRNLRKRIATVAYYDLVNLSTTILETDYASAIHYSYDQHGNVTEEIQDVPMLAPVNQDVKSVQYDFELISGTVQQISYQNDPESLDKFTHKYYYDQLNRLEEVHTSSDNVHFSREAHYYYFDYGPLARIELGQHQVQGMDYAYTINGWQKSMNSSILRVGRDMGRDGTTGFSASNPSIHSAFSKDVVAYSLGYFSGDYKSISGLDFETNYAGSELDTKGKALFNGNIRHTITSIFGMETLGMAYRYDQLQRLVRTASFSTNVNSFANELEIPDYKSTYSYDENGNIENLRRNGYGSQLHMDEFTYKYENPIDPDALWNRLQTVLDVGADYTNSGTGQPVYDDIKAASNNQFEYNKIGQLTVDVAQALEFEWFLGNKKVKKITGESSSPDIEFKYNPFGQRILKIVKPKNGLAYLPQDQWKYTYYSYDANGECMAVYDVVMSSGQNQAVVSEQPIYGGNRIGLYKSGKFLYLNNLAMPPEGPVYENTLGKKHFEITNHLGNVNAVITDRKMADDPGAASAFVAVNVMEADYYPFGMTMPGDRSRQSSEYRYGYNGMEKDDEIKGEGNSIDFGNRMYDPRLARWFIPDRAAPLYPSTSPYAYALNSPIAGKDIDGDYTIFINGLVGYGGAVKGSRYWRGSKKNPNQFVNAAHSYFGDAIGIYYNGSGGLLSLAPQRQEMGREMGRQMLSAIKAKVLSGEVTELNFVSHSQGAAVSEGIIEIFMEDDVLRTLLEKGQIVHMSAANASDIKISDNSKHLNRTQLNYVGDETIELSEAYRNLVLETSTGGFGSTLYEEIDNKKTGGGRIPGVQKMGVVHPDMRYSHPYMAENGTDYDWHNETKWYAQSWDFVRLLDKTLFNNPLMLGSPVHLYQSGLANPWASSKNVTQVSHRPKMDSCTSSGGGGFNTQK